MEPGVPQEAPCDQASHAEVVQGLKARAELLYFQERLVLQVGPVTRRHITYAQTLTEPRRGFFRKLKSSGCLWARAVQRGCSGRNRCTVQEPPDAHPRSASITHGTWTERVRGYQPPASLALELS